MIGNTTINKTKKRDKKHSRYKDTIEKPKGSNPMKKSID